jgi:hypothetical protein
MITLIGIKKVLLSAISASVDVNILTVSRRMPKLDSENSIASTFHLFIKDQLI